MSERPALPAHEPAVRVVDVVKRFDDEVILDGASMTVAPGEFVVVTGPSGAGKTTLLHLLAGLDRPQSGSICVFGHELGHLHALNRYRRSEVGLIFQLHNLIPRLTAHQNVAIALFGTGLGPRQRSDRAAELLEEVGLSHRADSRPPTMSGGERQRVAIARALANRPRLLLADEPTGSLDDDTAASVLDLIVGLRATQGLTVLAVSHDPRLNERADRLLRLEGGRIVSVESPAATDPPIDQLTDRPTA